MALSLQLKRNSEIPDSKEAALSGLTNALSAGTTSEGEPMIGIYNDGAEGDVKILFGIADGSGHSTIFDSEAIPADVQEAIDAIMGGDPNDEYDTITEISSALTIINGDESTEGSIAYGDKQTYESAATYTDNAIAGLDVADTAVSKSFVTEVSETDGKIAVKRGAVTSKGGTIVLSDGADGGINIEVVSSALTQYVGDKAIKVNAETGETNTKTISLAINTADKVLTQSGDGLLANINLSWDKGTGLKLLGKDGAAIATIPATDFIKDGMLQNVELKVATPEEHVGTATTGTFLVFTFNTDAGSQPINLDVTSLIDVYTAGNGIDVTGKKISAKIDPTTEKFLTVGADGIKLSGVQDAINAVKSEENAAINKIEASVGLAEDGSHITTSGNYTSGASTIAGEIAALDTQVKKNADAIGDETSRAKGVEQGLQTAIDNEVSARTAADEALQKSIDAVSGAAISVVAGNGIQISGDGKEKTIAAKLGTNSNTTAILELTGNGIRVKDNAVLDMGTY